MITERRTWMPLMMPAAEDVERMACHGAPTIAYDWTDMVECVHCGTRTRWDLTEHSFFGFAASGCPNAKANAKATP